MRPSWLAITKSTNWARYRLTGSSKFLYFRQRNTHPDNSRTGIVAAELAYWRDVFDLFSQCCVLRLGVGKELGEYSSSELENFTSYLYSWLEAPIPFDIYGCAVDELGHRLPKKSFMFKESHPLRVIDCAVKIISNVRALFCFLFLKTRLSKAQKG